MKILLDEGVPRKLWRTLQENTPDHQLSTAQNVGLTGDSPEFRNLNSKQKDEKLLREAKSQGFDAVITIDKSMQVEQNGKTPIHVITIDVGRDNKQTFENIQPLLPDIEKEIIRVALKVERGDQPSFSIVGIEDQNRQTQAEPAPARKSLSDYQPKAPEPDKEQSPGKRPGERLIDRYTRSDGDDGFNR